MCLWSSKLETSYCKSKSRPVLHQAVDQSWRMLGQIDFCLLVDLRKPEDDPWENCLVNLGKTPQEANQQEQWDLFTQEASLRELCPLWRKQFISSALYHQKINRFCFIVGESQ